MKKFLLFFIILLIVLAILFGWAYNIIFVSQSSADELKLFKIEQGTSVNSIADNLKSEGLISNVFIFKAYLKVRGYEDNIQAGEHYISGDMAMNQVVNNLISGASVSNEMKLTFLPGWDLRDIGFYLEDQGIAQAEELWELVGYPAVNYDTNTELPKPKDFSRDYEFLSEKPDNISLEGYLYPDTYRFFKDATLEDIVVKMLDTFDHKLNSKMLGEIDNQGKNLYDILTLASIIEKEGDTPENKKKVAGVYYNRLEIGMALQADPTVNYVTGKTTDRPTYDDIDTDNHYNTYQNPGLPPGPICNPGIDSIMAAIYPDKNDYLFFINTPDGEMVFAENFEQHKANRFKYFKD